MTLILAEPLRPRHQKRHAIAAMLLAGLGLAGGAAVTEFHAHPVDGVIKSAKAEIEGCTLRGVGASMANGQITLRLPAGCRLAG